MIIAGLWFQNALSAVEIDITLNNLYAKEVLPTKKEKCIWCLLGRTIILFTLLKYINL